jgi:hypothetical protein
MREITHLLCPIDSSDVSRHTIERRGSNTPIIGVGEFSASGWNISDPIVPGFVEIASRRPMPGLS